MQIALNGKKWHLSSPLHKLLRIMKLTILLLTITALHVSAKGYAQKITLHTSNAPLEKIFESITSQSGYRFFYNEEQIKKSSPVTVNIKEANIKEVLEICFRDQPFTYDIVKDVIVIREKSNSPIIQPQQKDLTIDIHGRIVNENGEPIEGVTVTIKGSKKGTSTNVNGEFALQKADENSTLVFTGVNIESYELKVEGKTELAITLKTKITSLGDVVVNVNTGYQTLPKERATGSFDFISNKMYNQQVGTNVLDRLPAIANSLTKIPSRILNSDILTIRGLSTMTTTIARPLVIVDNFPYEGDIRNINPNDIENITILKDAAAASIWGARAGNGVIVISTKKGQFAQKVKVEVNTNLTIINQPDLFTIKNISTSDYIDVEKFLFSKGYYNGNLQFAPYYYQTPVVDILEKIRTGQLDSAQGNSQINGLRNNDIRKEFEKYFYQSAINQQYAVNLRGGSNNIAWIASVGYDRNLDELNGHYDRFNFRTENTYKLLNNLLVSAGVYYTQSNSNSGKPAYRTLPIATGTPPLYTSFSDPNGLSAAIGGNLRKTFTDTAGAGKLLDWNYYPLEDYKHAQSTGKIQDIKGNFGLSYKPLNELNIDIRYQYERQQTTNRFLADQQSYSTRDLINSFSQVDYMTGNVKRPVPLGSILDMNTNTLTSQNFRTQVNFNKTWGVHNISALGGMEISELKNNGNIFRTYGYNDDVLTSVPVDYANRYPHFITDQGLGFIPNLADFNNTVNRFVSYFLNAAYSYNRKYIFSLSGRRDASNLFGTDFKDKWKPLWSTGLAWQISDESFYKSSFLPVLKLRATYGYNGNVDPNRSPVPTIAYSVASPYTLLPVAKIANIPNPDLRWEKVGIQNFGIDFKTRKNILSGSIEYFIKRGSDLYSFVPVDLTLGLNAPFVSKNAAEMKGHGVDIELNSININGALRWTSNLNFNYYKDKVTKFASSTSAGSNYVSGKGGAIEGYPLYSLFTYRWAGLDLAGNPQGYLKKTISQDYAALVKDSIQNLVYNGSALPTFYGSFGNTIEWKNFSLTTRIVYKLGYYFQRESIDYNLLISSFTGHSDFSDRWQKPGDEKRTHVPAMIYPNNSDRDFFYTNSEVLATRGDHIRLQYINFGYDVNSKKHKLPFSSLKLYFVANNLGIIWRANKYHIDPDYSNNQIIPTKNFSFGVNAIF